MAEYGMNRRVFLRSVAFATGAAVVTACTGAAGPTAPSEPAATQPPVEAPTVTVAAAAPPSAKYGEAPMLAEMAAAGTILPVEERLPKNPLVMEPLESIGTYGGTWQRAMPNVGEISHFYGAEPIVTYSREFTIEPNLAYKWDILDDGKEYIFYLREGLRWSDGEPLTADDIMFWYEDILLNPELSPAFPRWLSPGGVPVEVSKVDDYAVSFKFAVPYGIFLDQMAFSGVAAVNYPKHHMSQFHVKYADADELAAKIKERGFETWFQLFGAQMDFQRNPDLPTVHPWKITSKDWTTVATAERNPYYFKVDTEGNQLPYIDKMVWNIVASAEMVPMKVVSGEVDCQVHSTGINNYTLYMENREKGDYEVHLWDFGQSATAMQLNQTKKVTEGDADAEGIKQLLRNYDFRLALSQAIDRDDVNELIYMGFTAPAIDLWPEAVKANPDVIKEYVYDVEAANALLDGLGMTERDGDGMRLTPEGKQLNLGIIGLPEYAIHLDVAELVMEFWREVGVATTLDAIPGEVWWPRVREGDFDVVAYQVDYATTPRGTLYALTYPRSLFPVDTSTYWAPRWGTYYATGGAEGDEPDIEDGKRLVQLYEQALATVDQAAKDAIMDEAFTILAVNMWPIQLGASRSEPCIIKNNFKNWATWGQVFWPFYGIKCAKPEQCYIEQA